MSNLLDELFMPLPCMLTHKNTHTTHVIWTHEVNKIYIHLFPMWPKFSLFFRSTNRFPEPFSHVVSYFFYSVSHKRVSTSCTTWVLPARYWKTAYSCSAKDHLRSLGLLAADTVKYVNGLWSDQTVIKLENSVKCFQSGMSFFFNSRPLLLSFT